MLIEPQLLGSMREEMLFYSKKYSPRLSVDLLKMGWMKEWLNGQINKRFIPGYAKCFLITSIYLYFILHAWSWGHWKESDMLQAKRNAFHMFWCFVFFLYSYVLLALFIITKTWKQSKCQLGNRLTNCGTSTQRKSTQLYKGTHDG